MSFEHSVIPSSFFLFQFYSCNKILGSLKMGITLFTIVKQEALKEVAENLVPIWTDSGHSNVRPVTFSEYLDFLRLVFKKKICKIAIQFCLVWWSQEIM